MLEHYAVEWTEWFVHKLLFWETDNKVKGRILRAFHHAATYALLTLMIVAHTLYPVFWFQTTMVFVYAIVWFQHILTNGCVISKVEQKLLEDESSFIDPFLELFHIKSDEESKPGLLILGSTVVMICLGLEWVARVVHKLKRFLELQVPVSEPIRRILAA
jgi:hypothetical protein